MRPTIHIFNINATHFNSSLAGQSSLHSIYFSSFRFTMIKILILRKSNKTLVLGMFIIFGYDASKVCTPFCSFEIVDSNVKNCTHNPPSTGTRLNAKLKILVASICLWLQNLFPTEVTYQ